MNERLPPPDVSAVAWRALPPPSSAATRLAYAGYDVLGGLAALLALPALPWLLLRGYGVGAGERLGRVPPVAMRLPAPPVWLHCASVGETRSAVPLVARLRERLPQRPLVISTTTLSGRGVAAELGADVATLLPIDALRIIDRVFRRVRPRLLILIETELWPGLLRAAAKVGAPVAIVSGRLSPRALEHYRWAGPLFPAALAQVAAFGMQTAADAERIIALGAPPERVRVTGTLKASAPPPTPAPPPLEGLGERRVLIAASTQPGEEEFVLQAFAALRRVYRDALLIIAPRRPERFDAVAALVTAAGFVSARRSALQGERNSVPAGTAGPAPTAVGPAVPAASSVKGGAPSPPGGWGGGVSATAPPPGRRQRAALQMPVPNASDSPGGAAVPAVAPEIQVLVLDTLGELVRFFPAGWAVFVGGTVAPLGGHNVLEPATYGKPVAFGPHTENVAGAAAALCAAGGGTVVRTPAQLAEHWDGLLAHRGAAESAGARARGAAAAQAEALDDTWELLAPLLRGHG